MCFSALDNSGLVASSTKNVVSGNVDFEAFEGQSCASSAPSGHPSSTPENETRGVSVIRDLYHRQGLERETVDIILNSWRPSTKAQYMTYINRYISFSVTNMVLLPQPCILV